MPNSYQFDNIRYLDNLKAIRKQKHALIPVYLEFMDFLEITLFVDTPW